MKTRTNQSVGLAWTLLLFLLLLPAPASAFYNPQSGRWLSRDPVDEPGFETASMVRRKVVRRENSPYLFVQNGPLDKHDLLGLVKMESPSGTSRCSDPCGQAKKEGLDVNEQGQHDGGGVICCAGIKYVCSWQPSYPNAQASAIVTKCTIEHEKTHLDDVNDCPRVWCYAFPTRPKYKSSKSEHDEECSGFKTQLQCYQNSLAECGGDLQCQTIVNTAITLTEQKLKDLNCQ